MSKKKNSPALFELLYKSKVKAGEQLMVPAWMTGGKKAVNVPSKPPAPAAPPQAEETPPEGEVAEEIIEAEEPQAVAAPSTAEVDEAEAVAEPPPPKPEVKPPPVPPRPEPPPRRARPTGKVERLVRTDGKRLKLSISTSQAVAAGVVLLAVVVGVFLLGRAATPTGKPPAETSSAGSEASPARSDVLKGGVADRPAAAPREVTSARPMDIRAASPGATPTLVKGKYYLVVQGMMGAGDGHYAAAREIAEFLNDRDEPVKVMWFKGPPAQYIVLSLRGFEAPDSPAAKRYLRAIEELGKLYRSQGGRYDFRQGESGWFVKGE